MITELVPAWDSYQGIALAMPKQSFWKRHSAAAGTGSAQIPARSGLPNSLAMRQKSSEEKKEAWRRNQNEERPPRQMSRVKQTPDVERYQASQSQRSSELLTKPSQGQSNTNPNRPQAQTNPLLKRRSRAAALSDSADSEPEDDKYAENAPYTSNPAGYEYGRAC
jgi:hypothetical protein